MRKGTNQGRAEETGEKRVELGMRKNLGKRRKKGGMRQIRINKGYKKTRGVRSDRAFFLGRW